MTLYLKAFIHSIFRTYVEIKAFFGCHISYFKDHGFIINLSLRCWGMVRNGSVKFLRSGKESALWIVFSRYQADCGVNRL